MIPTREDRESSDRPNVRGRRLTRAQRGPPRTHGCSPPSDAPGPGGPHHRPRAAPPMYRMVIAR